MSKPKKGTDNSKSATTGIVYISFNFNSVVIHLFQLQIFDICGSIIIWTICYAVRTTTYETESGEVETVQDYTMTGGDVTQERMSNHPASSKSRVRIQTQHMIFITCLRMPEKLYTLQLYLFQNYYITIDVFFIYFTYDLFLTNWFIIRAESLTLSQILILKKR